MSPTANASETRRSRWTYGLMAAVPLVPLAIGLFIVLGGSDDQGLADARDLWETHGPHGYVMEIETSGMAGVSATTLTVRDGVVIANDPAVDAAYEPHRWTVDDLFDQIDQVLDSGEVADLEWHAELGYPTRAILDPAPHTADDEWAFVVTSLEPTD